MNATIQIADLFPIYPEVVEDKFQTKIAAKKEFSELKSSRQEPTPSRGTGYRHQIIIERYMREYDEMLLIHETGTGKSCAISRVAEWLKKEFSKGKSNIKRAYFITKSKTLIAETKRQIACSCTPAGEYDQEGKNTKDKESVRKAAISRNLSKWYSFTTWGTLANQLRKLSDTSIAVEYSDSVFFVDEVHNLRLEDDTEGYEDEKTNTIASKKEVYDQLQRLFKLAKRSKVVLATATPMVNTVNEIASIINLFPRQPHFKQDFDFSRATLKDLEPYFRGRVSYVRSLDTSISVHQEGQTYEYSSKESNAPIAFTVYPSVMSDFQREAYKAAAQADGGAKSFLTNSRQAANFVFPDGSWGTAGFNKYVNKTTGYTPVDELKDILDEVKNDGTARAIEPYSCKYAAIADIENKAATGCGYVFGSFVKASGVIIISMILEALGFERFRERSSVFAQTKTGNKSYCSATEGNLNVIFSFKKKKRYAILTSETDPVELSAMMEVLKSEANIHGEYIKTFIASPVAQEGISVNNFVRIHICNPSWNEASLYQAETRVIRAVSHVALLRDKEEQLIKEGKDPKTATISVDIYRHAALIDEDLPEQLDNMDDLDTLGVDIFMYLKSEDKNRPIKRVLRIAKQSAFDCLINKVRNTLTDKKDDYTAKCDYDKCNYECFDPEPTDEDYRSYDASYLEEQLPQKEGRVDLLNYTENKTTGIIDPLNYHKHKAVISGKCIDEVEIYGESLISLCMDAIQRILLEESYITTHNLIECLKGKFRNRVVQFSIEYLISHKVSLNDRYGFECYLRENNGILFLDRRYPVNEGGDNYASLIYSSDFIGIRERTLKQVVDVITGLGQSKAVKKILQNIGKIRTEEEKKLTLKDIQGKRDPRVTRQIEQLKSLDERAQLLENTILDFYIRGNKTVENQYILEEFKNVFFIMHEPVTEIENQKARVRREGNEPKRGRQRSMASLIKPKKINIMTWQDDAAELTYDTKTPLVYLHTIYTLASEKGQKYGQVRRWQAVYSESNNVADIRILKTDNKTNKPDEVKWRDTDKETEYPVYATFIQIEIAKIFSKYIDVAGLFGVMSYDQANNEHVFRLADFRDKEQVAYWRDWRKRYKAGKEDKPDPDPRDFRMGQECITKIKSDLLDIAYYINAPIPASESYIPEYKNIEDLQDIYFDITRRGSSYTITNKGKKIVSKTLKADDDPKVAEEVVLDWPEDKLKYYIRWMIVIRFPQLFNLGNDPDKKGKKFTNVTRPYLCNVIWNHIINTNRVLYILP